ncbi:MAG: NUDIX hydrolase [Bryobacteraceae bacterium]
MTSLVHLLEAHRPFTQREAAMLAGTLAFVRADPAHLDAGNPPGHITGSAWVLDESRSLVILTHHRKLGRWFQLGGHLDPGESVAEGALREAREESGLTEVRLIDQAIFDVDVHPIPARGAQPEHLHYDIRFLCETPHVEPRPTAESRAVAWVRLVEVAALNPDESMTRMVEKTLLRWRRAR